MAVLETFVSGRPVGGCSQWPGKKALVLETRDGSSGVKVVASLKAMLAVNLGSLSKD